MEDRLKKIRIHELRQKQRCASGEPLSKRFVRSVVTSYARQMLNVSRNLTRKVICRMTMLKHDLCLMNIIAMMKTVHNQRNFPVLACKKAFQPRA